MRIGRECRNIVLATLILLVVVQPGAIVVATTDAPYNFARSVSTWGMAFIGGSPLLLAYALVRFFRMREKKVLTCAGIVLAFVLVVAALSLYLDRIAMEPYFRRLGEKYPERAVSWFLVGSGAVFLLSVMSTVMSIVWVQELPHVYSSHSCDVPLGIVELLLIGVITWLAVKGKQKRYHV